MVDIAGWIKLGLGIIPDWWPRTPKPAPVVLPEKTLVALPEQRPNSLFWTKASTSSQPATMVLGDFQFTNVHEKDTSVAQSFLVVGRWPQRSKYPRDCFRAGDLHTGSAAIPPNKITTGRMFWIIQPPIASPGKALRARVIFVDRFGNEHWTTPLTFESR
jgi:hypothetical protein